MRHIMVNHHGSIGRKCWLPYEAIVPNVKERAPSTFLTPLHILPLPTLTFVHQRYGSQDAY